MQKTILITGASTGIGYYTAHELKKAGYYVTAPTYLVGFMKRILPARWLDKLLRKLGS